MKNLMVILSLSVILSSCAPIIICAGGAAGVALRNRDGIGGTVSDNAIHAKILADLSKASLFKNVEVVVKHSRVLLLGYIENENQRVTVLEIVNKVDGIKEVIDCIKIGAKVANENSVSDSWVTSRIKSSMALDGNVHSLNFNVTTYNGVVYILGTTESQMEMEIVINIARSTSYVKKVVSYIKIENNDKK